MYSFTIAKLSQIMTKTIKKQFTNKIIHKDKFLNFNLSKNKRLKRWRILLFHRINRHKEILVMQIFKLRVSNEMKIEAFNIEKKEFIKNLNVDN